MPEQAQLRYLTYGHSWLILVDLTEHGYHHAEREHQTKQGPVGLGFVLVVPTADLDATWTRRDEGRHGRADRELAGRRVPGLHRPEMAAP